MSKFFLSLILIAGLSLTPACSSISKEEESQLIAATQAASTEATNAITKIDAEIARVQSIQPVDQKQIATLQQAKGVIESAKKSVDSIGPILQAAVSGQDPGAAITAAAPMTGPAAPYVALAGILVSAGYSVWQTLEKKKAQSAGKSAVDAVELAIANGELVKTVPSAVKTVDDRIDDNKISNRLTDVVAAAPIVEIKKA